MVKMNIKTLRAITKTAVTVCLISIVFTACDTSDKGQLVGVRDRQMWYQPTPYGMVFIPLGSFIMGQSDQDVPYNQIQTNKVVSLQAFYMDETEITNNEYRQFVYWVRDSIAHTILGEINEEHLITQNEYGEELYPPAINWKTKINWEGQEEREYLADMYLPEHERFFRRKQFDVRKWNYEYYWIDYRAAAAKNWDSPLTSDQTDNVTMPMWNNRPQGYSDRSVYVKKDVINVFPDTLCWVHDFTYSFNEPMTQSYFWHPAYDNYPVVGVNWKQARAFSIWRTNYLNAYLSKTGSSYVNDFRLPTESEWEYAARGGLQLSPYPWGGPYTRNYNGCFLANFKPLRGNYVDDGGLHTVIVAHYSPNDYGLYDMAGNVAEWTSNAFDPSTYQYAHDLNMDYTYEAKESDPPVLKRKVIRGGSWKDISFYMQVSTRDYEYQDSATSYIGFRNVQTYLGRHKDDGPMSSNVYR
ncbi:MAG: SUMF1/EgtB/PvdO family nonheme iron enzyme [Bacteroidales bacterium]|jgi:sulfatase modifying factor 1